jgi:hypothetical protein
LARVRRSKRSASRTAVLDSKAEIDRFASRIQTAIKIVGGILAALFTWLQLKDFPFIPLLESTPPEAILKFIIAVYYFSWVFGSSFDVRLQQSVYVSDPGRGQLTWPGIVALGALAVIAAVLLWVSDSTKEFAVVLHIFVLADLLTWKYYLIPRTTPIIRASKGICAKDREFFDLERLSLVESYMVGKWHWYRFIALGALLLIIDVLCFIDPIRALLGALIESAVPGLKTGLATSLLPVLSIVAFIVVAEGWKWMLRINMRTALQVISDLKKKYRAVISGDPEPRERS